MGREQGSSKVTWLSTIAETSGHPTGGLVLLSVDTFTAMGEAITRTMPVYSKGARLVKSKKLGYCLAVGLMQHRFGPSAIEQFRRISGEHSIGFDVGVSIHAGQMFSTPPVNLTDPSALAGFFLAHGIVGSPTCHEVLKMAVREPEYRIGVAVAVRSMNEGRKSKAQKLFESFIGV
jgi:hypothetical protein